ncbi:MULTISPECIES: nSTAND1 domain-containing NTPase [unclassified Corallococcus]|uniref:nSTAND1 domain-containing NTPase n=1 Tax=unclassified Corallococcus TaxID=2685029 RepID=UPI001A8FD7E8|nr:MULTISPECIES: TIR domain-containing protein [unclassified Corallococcus]MBN9685191.1 TIR domain-containing protein [Corallococcus sp. NCSPR001]WAS83350.1 TIR domain-containing protein [Corallococcus sp. NCRR]
MPPPEFDVFVCYAEQDQEWVLGLLLDALKRAGLSCHTEAAFALGVPRVLEFEKALQCSARTVLVLSPAFRADAASRFVSVLAMSYDLEHAAGSLVPLLYRPVETPAYLQGLELLDATTHDKWPAALERLCALLKRPIPEEARKPRCPYPGMVPFRADDARFFHGRQKELGSLQEKLLKHRRVLVVGPSASGKSSLLRAGFLPSYLADPRWVVRTLRPGEAPGSGLEELKRDPAVRKLLANESPKLRLLLVVDPLEELFTLASAQQQRRFIAGLQEFHTRTDCHVVAALRADFYPELMGSDLWPIPAEERLEIIPLRGQALRAAIEQPAIDVGAYLERELTERLLADVQDEPGALPLLQETLVLLWERMTGRIMTAHAYQELGQGHLNGLAVAMAARAEGALGELSREPATVGVARRMFLRLIQFGQGRSDTRRQLPVSALRTRQDEARLFEQTLQYLAGTRLITLSGEQGEADRLVDISHEALLQAWPTLRGWIEEKRSAEQTRRRLEEKSEEWLRLKRKGGLLDLAELAEARRYLSGPNAHALGSSTTLEGLVSASWRRVYLLRALTAFVFLVILGAAGGMLWQRWQAESLLAGSLFREAQHHWEEQKNDSLAVLPQLSKAFATAPPRDAQASTYALRLLHLADRGPCRVENLAAPFSRYIVSPDRKTIVITAPEGTVQVWDMTSGQILPLPFAQDARVLITPAFSADGQRLATITEGLNPFMTRTLHVWNARTGTSEHHLAYEHTSYVEDLVFTSNGQAVLLSRHVQKPSPSSTGSPDGELPPLGPLGFNFSDDPEAEVVLIDWASRAPRPRNAPKGLLRRAGPLSIAAHPGWSLKLHGRHLLTIDNDEATQRYEVRLVDMETGRPAPEVVPMQHTHPVRDAIVTGDSERFVFTLSSAQLDAPQELRIFEASTGRLKASTPLEKGGFHIGSTGHKVLLLGAGNALVWDWKVNQRRPLPSAPLDGAPHYFFARGDTVVLAVSDTGAIKAWSSEDGRPLPTRQMAPLETQPSLLMSQDASSQLEVDEEGRLLELTHQGTLRISNVLEQPGTTTQSLPGLDRVTQAAFSSKRKWLVTIREDSPRAHLQLWEVEGLRPLWKQPRVLTAFSVGAQFSADESCLLLSFESGASDPFTKTVTLQVLRLDPRCPVEEFSFSETLPAGDSSRWGPPASMQLDRTGQYLTAGWGGLKLQRWDLKKKQAVWSAPRHHLLGANVDLIFGEHLYLRVTPARIELWSFMGGDKPLHVFPRLASPLSSRLLLALAREARDVTADARPGAASATSEAALLIKLLETQVGLKHSPDGFFFLNMDSSQPWFVPGLLDDARMRSPFVSPNGRWLGFGAELGQEPGTLRMGWMGEEPDSTLHVFDLASGTPLLEEQHLSPRVVHAAFDSASESVLLLHSNGQLRKLPIAPKLTGRPGWLATAGEALTGLRLRDDGRSYRLSLAEHHAVRESFLRGLHHDAADGDTFAKAFLGRLTPGCPELQPSPTH